MLTEDVHIGFGLRRKSVSQEQSPCGGVFEYQTLVSEEQLKDIEHGSDENVFKIFSW